MRLFTIENGEFLWSVKAPSSAWALREVAVAGRGGVMTIRTSSEDVSLRVPTG